MKKLAILAFAVTSSTFAGIGEVPRTVPDAGASVLLLGLGFAVVGLMRRSVKR